ncbi:hypothetical protein J6590_079200 [Homalodisca vitripennis]|nr:hypothetical protein J6590_079200 [Homalodisca vitripennis]
MSRDGIMREMNVCRRHAGVMREVGRDSPRDEMSRDGIMREVNVCRRHTGVMIEVGRDDHRDEMSNPSNGWPNHTDSHRCRKILYKETLYEFDIDGTGPQPSHAGRRDIDSTGSLSRRREPLLPQDNQAGHGVPTGSVPRTQL